MNSEALRLLDEIEGEVYAWDQWPKAKGAQLRALLSAQEPTDECAWVGWSGGICQLPAGTVVEALHRDGTKTKKTARYGDHWKHVGTPCDIVAYRLLDPGELAKQEAK